MNFIKKYIQKGSERSIIVKKNIALSFIIKGYSILLSLVFVSVLLGFLDKEKYGIWLTISSLANWIGYFDLGLNNGLKNRLTTALAEDNKDLASKLVSTSYFLLSIVFGSIIVLVLLTFPFMNWESILNTNVISNNELKIITIYVSIMFCLNFILNIINAILFAKLKTALSNLIHPISQTLILISIYFITRYSSNGTLLTLCILLSSTPVIVTLILSIYYYKFKYKELKPSFKKIEMKLSKDILSMGGKFFLIQLAALIIYQSSNFIITKQCGPEQVVPYNIGLKYFGIITMISTIILSPMWSAVTHAIAQNDFAWLKRSLKKLNKISFLLSLCIVFLYIFKNQVFQFWVNDEKIVSVDLSIAFVINSVIVLFAAPYSQFISGLGKLKLGMFIVYAKMILFIPLAIFLTKEWGPIGMAYSMSVVYLISFVFEYIQVNKIINQRANGIWNK